MIWIPLAMVVGGLVLLTFAADRFVLAASRLSRLWGMSPILIGALVVGMGTSSPELLVSILAAVDGELDLAIGNVVGSNVANVTLVLGATSVLVPVAGNLRVLRREGVLMLIAVLALAAMLFDLHLQRWEGLTLAGSMLVAAMLVVRWARADKADGLMSFEGEGEEEPSEVKLSKEIVLGLLSLGATLLGAELLVRGGVDLAKAFGVDEAFIGMTLVAVGTSLPELATSIAGIRRQEHDMILGNVLGSNLFNALAVGGVAASIDPGQIDTAFRTGSIAMVICAALAGLLAFTGRQLVRWEGLILLVGYAGFVILGLQ